MAFTHSSGLATRSVAPGRLAASAVGFGTPSGGIPHFSRAYPGNVQTPSALVAFGGPGFLLEPIVPPLVARKARLSDKTRLIGFTGTRWD